MATVKQILEEMRRHADPECVAGMARYGITPKRNYGLSMPRLQSMARRIGIDHRLALGLWSSGIRDARLLATMIEDPAKLTEKQADSWVKGMDSWDVCDSACMRVFCETKFARKKISQWAGRREEYVKRAGLSTLAFLAIHDKKAPDSDFEKFLSLIEKAASDDRNYVKKAANWALRTIGKRSLRLNKAAVKAASKLSKSTSKSARWAGSDALRELRSAKIQERLRSRERRRKEKGK